MRTVPGTVRKFSTFAFPLFPDFNQIVPYILRKDDLYAIPRFKNGFYV